MFWLENSALSAGSKPVENLKLEARRTPVPTGNGVEGFGGVGVGV